MKLSQFRQIIKEEVRKVVHEKNTKHIQTFESFISEKKTYNKYDVWEPNPNSHVYDSDWKKLLDYFKEEYRRGNEIDEWVYGDKNIQVDYSVLSPYWRRWFDKHMIRTSIA